MFGFAKLFTIGALAISASAAPLIGNANVAVSVGSQVKTGTAAVSAQVNATLGAVNAGSCGCASKTLQGVLVPLTATLNLAVENMTATNCTGMSTNEISAALAPSVEAIVLILNEATSNVVSLNGLSIEAILASTEGGVSLTVTAVADLIATILKLVIGATGTVIGSAPGNVDSGLLMILAPIGTALAALLSAINTLVGNVLGGLTPAVVDLIGQLIPVVLQLNVPALSSLLCF